MAFRLARWAARLGTDSRPHDGATAPPVWLVGLPGGEGVMRQVLVTAVNESYEEQLARLALPVVLLWGADDAEVPVEVAERAAALLTAAGSEVRLVVEPGVGHLLPLVAPATLRRAVAEMIGAVNL